MLNHEIRRQGIGASDVGAILGLSPWKTPLGVYHYIKHGVRQKDNASMANGRLQEKGILDAYEADKHIVLERNQQIIDKTCEIFRCNLDGINRVMRLPVEAKTAFYRHKWGEAGSDCFPKVYQIQCGYQAAIVDAPRVDVAVKFGDATKIEYFVYNRNHVLEKKLRDKVLAWWEKHIIKNVPPEPITPEDYKRFVDVVYIEAPDKILTLYEQYKKVKGAAKEEEKIKEELKAWTKKQHAGKAIVQFPDETTLAVQDLRTTNRVSLELLKAANIDIEKYKKKTTDICFKLR